MPLFIYRKPTHTPKATSFSIYYANEPLQIEKQTPISRDTVHYIFFCAKWHTNKRKKKKNILCILNTKNRRKKNGCQTKRFPHLNQITLQHTYSVYRMYIYKIYDRDLVNAVLLDTKLRSHYICIHRIYREKNEKKKTKIE